MSVRVDYCGEEFVATPEAPLTIGRDADLEIDDNPYLHRVFLKIYREHDLWWLSNVGSTLTATVADKAGLFQAWLAPGAGTCLMVEAIVRNQGRVLPCSVELQGEFGVTGAFVGVPVKLSAKGAEAVYEFELSAAEQDAFQKSVAANTELMNIAKTFL